MSTFTPEIEMQRRIVNLLRADSILSNSPGGLLYPVHSPKQAAEDVRVYSTGVTQPGEATFISAVPRILVEVMGIPSVKEQEPAILIAGCKVWTHSVTAKEDEELGGAIDARVRTLILSTWLSDARIITPRLVLDGNPRRERIEGLNWAWEFVSGFSTPIAGSLQ